MDELRRGEFEKALRERDAFEQVIGRDDEGYSTNVTGTSFVAPYVAGEIAAQHEKFPDLAEQDLVVAALMAASECPVTAVAGSDVPLEYHDNGRGIAFNPTHAGFGYFKANTYAEKVKVLAALAENNPGLSTEERTIYSSNFTTTEHDNEYQVAIDTQATSIRTMLHMQFEGAVPDSVTLQSPDGAEFTLSPAAETTFESGLEGVDFSGELTGKADMSTDAFLGSEVQGNWRIKIPQGYTLKLAELTVAGVEPGGVIDKFIDQEIALQQTKQREQESPTQTPHRSGRNCSYRRDR